MPATAKACRSGQPAGTLAELEHSGAGLALPRAGGRNPGRTWTRAVPGGALPDLPLAGAALDSPQDRAVAWQRPRAAALASTRPAAIGSTATDPCSAVRCREQASRCSGRDGLQAFASSPCR
jgi:hypothetical protein